MAFMGTDEMVVVIDNAKEEILSLRERIADLEPFEDKAWELENILRDLLFCHGEQMAIGGGPGWQERDRKAWAAAKEYFGDEG